MGRTCVDTVLICTVSDVDTKRNKKKEVGELLKVYCTVKSATVITSHYLKSLLFIAF